MTGWLPRRFSGTQLALGSVITLPFDDDNSAEELAGPRCGRRGSLANAWASQEWIHRTYYVGQS